MRVFLALLLAFPAPASAAKLAAGSAGRQISRIAGIGGAGVLPSAGRSAALSVGRPSLLPSLAAPVSPTAASSSRESLAPSAAVAPLAPSPGTVPALGALPPRGAVPEPADEALPAPKARLRADPRAADPENREAGPTAGRHPLVRKALLWSKSLSGRSLPEPAVLAPEAHIDRLSELLRLEEAAEAEHNRRLMQGSAVLREKLGTSVGGLELAGEDRLPGGGRVFLLTKRGSPGAFHGVARGDLVTITGSDGRPVDATVDSVRGDRVGVAVALGAQIAGRALRLDLASSDVTARRMREALEELRSTRDPNALRIRDVLFGMRPARVGRAPAEMRFYNQRLDEFQREAVRKAMAAVDVGVIHGPPGTGKTTTIVELIRQAVARKESVLATAPSNVAVDNILEKLLAAKLRVVRLGNPARVPEALRHLSLDAQVEASPEGQLLKKVKAELERMPPGSKDAIERKKRIRFYEDKIKAKILGAAQVVLATHGSIPGKLREESFDLVVLDEASQAVEPLSWIPLLQAKRAVFAGDHKQLPPTIQSQEAKRAGLGDTLMARMARLLPDALKSLLRVQYRMHEHIMEFASAEFYGGQLIAHSSVAGHTAKDLPGVTDTPLTRVPARFIDTAGERFDESFDELTQSYYNSGEAGMIQAIYRRLRAAGLKPEQIGVITPYSAQKRLLREKLGEPEVEINTVDGFQGREKEVILVSMVRSNAGGELGFLEELERLNVALTRPRRLRVVVGNSALLERQPSFSRFLENARARGYYRAAADALD